MNLTDAHAFAHEFFGDNYTLDHRQFSDGDSRIIVTYNVGWADGDYLTLKVWLTREYVTLSYYEDDCLRLTERFSLSEFEQTPLDEFLGDWVPVDEELDEWIPE